MFMTDHDLLKKFVFFQASKINSFFKKNHDHEKSLHSNTNDSIFSLSFTKTDIEIKIAIKFNYKFVEVIYYRVFLDTTTKRNSVNISHG